MNTVEYGELHDWLVVIIGDVKCAMNRNLFKNVFWDTTTKYLFMNSKGHTENAND
uniref:Uncharacterized protein n=1 Tax=Heterorhabditis bacteriophora TaxID=37862 RepID=A0A1I7WLM4_HETBA